MLFLVACGDPLQNVERLSDVPLAEDATELSVAATPGQPGFFAQIFQPQPEVDPVQAALAEAIADEPASEDVQTDTSTPEDIDAPADEGTQTAEVAAPRGLFGLFARREPEDLAPEVVSAEAISTDVRVEETSVDVSDAPEAAPVATTPRRAGLFSFLGRNSGATPTGPDAAQVTQNTVLEYGQIATNCDVPRRGLGTKIGEESGYTLYDTNPGTTAVRTHYLTGFDDNCARQFTAALSLMGDIGTHEVIRYASTGVSLDYSATDNAYEAIKASFCRVGHGEPCGDKLDRLARRTTFVTVYERFDGNPSWADILLHDGAVIAMDFQGR